MDLRKFEKGSYSRLGNPMFPKQSLISWAYHAILVGFKKQVVYVLVATRQLVA